MTAVTPERGDGLKPERCLNYEGAMSDLDSALGVLIRRINGEADLASAAEWVRLNYPRHAAALRPAPSPATDEVVEVLRRIVDEYGLNHTSKWVRDIARTTLASMKEVGK